MGQIDRSRAALQGLAPGLAMGLPGIVAGPPFGVMSTMGLGLNTTYYARFVPEEDMRITRLNFIVTTFDAANPAVDLAIYDATTLGKLGSIGAPQTGILNSNGTKSLSLSSPTFVAAGTPCYAALGSASNGIAVILARVLNNAFTTQLFGASPPNLYGGNEAAMPTPATANPSGTSPNLPWLIVRTD